MAEDFYDVLGVDRDASEEEIEQAFRKKASQYHPDVSDEPDAEERFKEIQRAKDVLTDEEKRQAYDQLGHERFEQAEKRGGFDDGPGGAGRGAGGPGGPFGGGGGDPFGGGMGDIFEQFFGGGGGDRSQGGADLRTDLEITLEEAYAGVEKRLTVTRPAACDDCGGSGHPPGSESRRCPECDGRGQVTQVRRTPLGQVQQTATCPRCEGEGRTHSETCSACGGEGQVREEATIAVEIPPGIRDGQTVRMDGEGRAGDRGAPAGDLLIEVSVADHPEFERDGADLHRQVPISFPQAVFGGDIEVETLDGPVEMDLPAGTQSGERFRLRGKGMPRLRGRGRGDLYAHVQVVTPEDLNEAQREALDAYAEAGGEEVDTEPDGLFDRLRESL